MSQEDGSPAGPRQTEQTPLLADQTSQDVEDASSASPNGDDGDIPLAEEPTTTQLVLILGSIWVGVFLGALGNPHHS